MSFQKQKITKSKHCKFARVPKYQSPGRPRTMLLDALMQEDEESVIDYTKLKEKAHDRETWRQWERTCLWVENTNNNNLNPTNLVNPASWICKKTMPDIGFSRAGAKIQCIPTNKHYSIFLWHIACKCQTCRYEFLNQYLTLIGSNIWPPAISLQCLQC